MKINVLSEAETLASCHDFSIARFGDGELRLAIGGGCSSQQAEKGLARELTDIMHTYRGFLVGVPNFEKSPRAKSWAKYAEGQFASLYKQDLYASSLITRPDSAPWIDTPEYWQNVRNLWAGKDVVLVAGDRKSITPEMLTGASSVRLVEGPRQHAYSQIDRIESEIGTPTGLVIMCLGAAATVLAARLDAKGVHALDLGHMGMFMKHAGAYAYASDDLTSPDYKRQLQKKHAGMKWGRSGNSHADTVIDFAAAMKATSVLDYGCGRGTLKAAVPKLKVLEYDPGIPGKDDLPKPADIVVSTDVLEHIEPDKVNRVLRHQYQLARKGGFFVIALSASREVLPDGRNAHLLIQSPDWWLEKLKESGWQIMRHELRKGLYVWCSKTI